MPVGIRTQDLQKIYTGAPPIAFRGPGSAIGASMAGRRRKAQKSAVRALDGVSLQVHPGEIFGLLGPNGAGKSTTVGILTTRVRPTAGRAWIGEHDVWQDPVTVKRLIGVVQQRPNLDFALTAREILTFHGAYFGMPARTSGSKADQLLERFKLTEQANRQPLGFSGGMMQRLSIARAMMHDPELLFLDEPSAGLDPQTRLLLWEIVREYNAEGRTILVTTHNMEEADQLCHRIAIIDHGRIIALGTPSELKHSIPGGYLLRWRFSSAPDGFVRRLETLAGVREVRTTSTGVDLYADRGGSLVPEVVASSSAEGIEIYDVQIAEPSLENLFLHHTGRSLRE